MQFSSKQSEYIRNANRRYNFKIGAVRSGKSYLDIAYTIPSRLRALKDKDGLNVILGVSKETVERNVLQPMREIYTDAVVGTINARNIAHIAGVPVYCLGAEKKSQVAKIQGSSIKYCYGDEIAKWNSEIFTMLQSRLDKAYSCFDGSCNPEYPSHWLKQFIDRPDIDAYIQKYTIFDNPFLPPKFVDNLCKEYSGTVYYGRYINGEWTLAEGLIYPMYSDCIIDTLPSEYSEYVISIDYGTQNAFAALLWGLNDETWYAIRGYYYSGRDTGKTKTDAEYMQDIELIFGDVIQQYYDDLKEYQKNPYKYNKEIPETIEVIIDPSAASFIAVLKKKSWCRVRKAVNDVDNGLRNTAVAMQKGIIKVYSGIKEWALEMGGYVWDDKSEEDKPIKVNDHYCDSTRYFVQTKKLVRDIDEEPQDSAFL